MDLYRVLRISIYLLVTSGAYAIWDVEGNPIYLLVVLAAGIVAHLTVDAGRFPPVRTGFAGALSLAMLLWFLNDSLRLLGLGWGYQAVATMTHFLICVQVVLFFTAFRGSVITFCASNLFIVVVSGILQQDLGLVFRLLLFLLAALWTLFVYALWRERSRFEAADTASAHRSGETPVRSTIGERSLRQGMGLTAMLSVFCILFGFLLFFTWPRLDLSAYVSEILPRRTPGQDPGMGLEGAGELSGLRGGHTQIDLHQDDIRLTEMGPLIESDRIAAKVIFDKPPSQWAVDERVYLRMAAFSDFRRNRWHRPPVGEDRFKETEPGAPLVVLPSELTFFQAPPGRQSLKQSVRLEGRPLSAYLHVAPPLRVVPAPDYSRGVQIDSEGGLFTVGRRDLQPQDNQSEYEVVSALPVHPGDLPAGTRAARTNGRYLRWEEGVEGGHEEIRRRAAQLTRGAWDDAGKAQRILQWLHSPRFHYSLERSGQPLHEFILSNDPAQRMAACGYFASAFVVLCRAAGLPARLVVGYAHNEDGIDKHTGVMHFRAKDAHAWGEVCFEGYHWVAFDPTPASGQTLPGGPDVAQTPPDPRGLHGEALPGPQEPRFSEPGWLERGWKYFTSYDHREQERIGGMVGEKLSGFFDGLAKMFSGSGHWGLAGAAVLWIALAALAGTALIAFLRGQERKRPLAHLPPRARAAVGFYNDLLTALGRRGFIRRPGQTAREFADAVIRRGGEPFQPVAVITTIFERIRYGDEEIDEGDLAQVRLSVARMQEALGATGQPG